MPSGCAVIFLAELGMEAPDTIEEFEAVLAAYKDANPGHVGMVFNQIPSWKLRAFPKKWVKDSNGGLVYGSVQPEAKATLEKLNSWYEKDIWIKSTLSRMTAKIANP